MGHELMRFTATKPVRDRVWTNSSLEEVVRTIRSNFPRLTGVLAALLDRLERKDGPQMDDNPAEAEGRCPHCGTELKVDPLEQQGLFK